MTKDCGFKDRMVLFRTNIVCRCHSAIVHFHILQVMDVMYACLGKVKGMDDST